MRDRYIVYSDEARVFVSDLPDDEIVSALDMLDGLSQRDGTDASHDDMRERLKIEQLIRAKGWRA